MRRHTLFVCLVSLASFPLGAFAQPRLGPSGGLRLDPNAPSATPAAEPATEETAETDAAAADEEEPALRSDQAEEEAQAEEAGALEAAAVPADADRLLEQAAPQENDPLRAQWTAPQRTFTIHGYLRTRGWLQSNYSLSRDNDVGVAGREFYPFPYFIPAERGALIGDGSTCGAGGTCYAKSKQFRYGDMRLRLAPTIALSDEIRIHALIDVFDNMVLGSTPDTGSVGALTAPAGSNSGIYPSVPVDSFASTSLSPSSSRNSFQDSIQVRRAWAEVGNHSIGQLRFGRMGNHWGLGMLWNDGRGLDSDFQTDVDRILGVTKWKGFTFGASWDFANAGVTAQPVWSNGIAYDPSSKDNLHQLALFAGHRLEADEQRRRLEAGKWVLNGGVYFQYQSQQLSYIPTASAGCPGGDVPGSLSATSAACLLPTGNQFYQRDASLLSFDGWAQFLFRDLRVELEIAARFGHLNIQQNTSTRYGVRQFGYALEAEYHVLDHKLGIYFNHGYASGDADVIGLSNREDHITQSGVGDHRVTTLSFHPNYRIDLILFRAILGSVAGVTYFKPGISYDLIRTAYGRILGARLDAIYSRANRAPQAYGDNANLGFEVDTSIYYRTEDGPDLLDGVFLGGNFGILIPLKGLGYAPGELAGGVDKTKPAMVFRLLMGVQF